MEVTCCAGISRPLIKKGILPLPPPSPPEHYYDPHGDISCQNLIINFMEMRNPPEFNNIDLIPLKFGSKKTFMRLGEREREREKLPFYPATSSLL